MAFSEEDKRIRGISMSSNNEEEIILIFATHPSIEPTSTHLPVEDSSFVWVYDCKLKRDIKELCQSVPNVNVDDWVRLFLKNSSQPKEREFLSAFLEKIASRAARNIYKSNKIPNENQLSYYRYDLYQIGWYISREPDVFFSSFDPQRLLEAYAYKKMEGKIKEEFCHYLGMGKRRSNWSLLWHTSRKRLKEALENKGYKQSCLDRYLLAWKSFKEIYTPFRPTNNGPLLGPTDKQLQQIANRYNQPAQSSLRVADFNRANQETIEQWLNQCIDAIRWHQNRTSYAVSLDSPIDGNENSLFLSETILDDEIKSQWELIEEREIQEWMPGLTTFLTESLTQIDEMTGNCLLLKYGFDLDYRSIAPIIKVDHTTVHRRDKNAMKQLIGQVARWAQESLNITPDSENLNHQKCELKNCLKKYYKKFIFESVFQTAWQQLDGNSQTILYLYYFRQNPVAAIANELQLGESQVKQQLLTAKQELAAAIREWTQERSNISPDLLAPLADHIAALVRTLIVNFIASDSKSG